MRIYEVSPSTNDIDSFINNFKKIFPEFLYSGKKSVSNTFGKFNVVYFSTDPNYDWYDHAYNKEHSGLVLWIFKDKIEWVDFGLTDDKRGTGKGEEIVSFVSKFFINYKIIINDDSDGFWDKMIPRYPNLEKM